MKKLYMVLGILLISALVLSACQKAATPTAAEKKVKVAMVLPGLKTDEAFNQYTYEGMMRAAKEFNLETGYV